MHKPPSTPCVMVIARVMALSRVMVLTCVILLSCVMAPRLLVMIIISFQLMVLPKGKQVSMQFRHHIYRHHQQSNWWSLFCCIQIYTPIIIYIYHHHGQVDKMCPGEPDKVFQVDAEFFLNLLLQFPLRLQVIQHFGGHWKSLN